MPSIFNLKTNKIENKNYDYLNRLGSSSKTSGTKGTYNNNNKYGNLEDISYKIYDKKQ